MAIDFYFDFISSFGYLARGRLLEIARRHDEEVRYHPVQIFRLRERAGSTGAAGIDKAPGRAAAASGK